jgi:hypothetical protein
MLRRAYGAFAARYLQVDPRTAGIYRIILGTLLCLDLIRHWGEARFLYSIVGALPNDKHLFRPSGGYLFSFFHSVSTMPEVHALFALGLLCHFLFLIGYRTRLFALLGFIFVTSMDSRIPLVENGGYVVVNLQCLYAIFLPLGKRFGVDAWRASWRAAKETTLDELADRSDPLGERLPTRTLVAFTALANLGIVYFFNVVNKTGQIWREGNTVHYVLHIDRMVTGVGVFAREHTPEWLMKVADYSTLGVEAMICVCILSWKGRKYARPLAMVLMTLLHGTFGVMMRLGPFSWFMIAWSWTLLLPIHFEWLQRFYERRTQPVRVGIAPQSALAMTVGRVVKRLDGYGRVSFEPAPEGATVAARVGESDAWVTEPAGVLRAIGQALPLGKWLGFVPRRLGGEAAFAAMMRNPSGVERFFALDLAPAAGSGLPAPLWTRVRRWLAYPREALVAYLALTAIMQVWMENKAIPKSIPPPVKEGTVLQADEKRGLAVMKKYLGDRVITLKPDVAPTFQQITINYPRIFQGWGMFAPNPIQDDGILAVDAFTIDGRHLDPFTGDAPDLNLNDARGAGLSQLRQDYGNRIRLDRNAYYREGLKEYLMHWHLETENPADELVAFDVYWVRDRCPKLGSDQPYDNDPVPLISWRKNGFKAPPGFPEIPPVPRARSAEKWDDEKAPPGRKVERIK